jgi:hypothetical protein
MQPEFSLYLYLAPWEEMGGDAPGNSQFLIDYMTSSEMEQPKFWSRLITD